MRFRYFDEMQGIRLARAVDAMRLNTCSPIGSAVTNQVRRQRNSLQDRLDRDVTADIRPA